MASLRTIASFLLIMLTVVLTACEEAPRTVVRYHVEDAWTLAQGAMKEAPLLVVVQGAPFLQPGEQLEASVLEIMTGAVTWTATPHFTVDRARSVSQSLRIVMTFNPPQGTSPNEQCAGQSTGGGPLREGAIRVLGAFCDAATILVSVSGRLLDATDPEDPRFAALVRQVTLDMLSPGQSGS